MSLRCFHCLRPLGKIYNQRHIKHTNILARYSLALSNICHQASFSTAPKVSPNVLKSRADEHSGIKSTLFESDPVQNILKRMTSADLDKIFQQRREDLNRPRYKLLDTAEIEEEMEKIRIEAEKHLVMPEVRSLRKPINVTLSKDPELMHNDEDGSDYVFTDISPSVDFRTRAVLVRENDTGILREGSWDERDRMQFMYWPEEGQTYELAPMLQAENLPFLFGQLKHVSVLDFINVQCEADAPDYIRVTQSVYEDIVERQAFDVLKSTRYFGGMVFYFVTTHQTSKLFSAFITTGLVDDAADLIRLHSLIHSDEPVSEDITNEHIIEDYIKADVELTHLLDYLNIESESETAQ